MRVRVRVGLLFSAPKDEAAGAKGGQLLAECDDLLLDGERSFARLRMGSAGELDQAAR